MLVGVVIIAILAAISYPRFQALRTKARLKEVPNTVQLILAAEKYYHFKKGLYRLWDYGEDPGDVLNIILPGADSMCQYQVTGSGSDANVQFQRRSDQDSIGSCNIESGDYTIDSDYEKYLGYLE